MLPGSVVAIPHTNADRGSHPRLFAGVNWTMIAALALIAVWIATIAGSIGTTGGWLIDGYGVPQNNDFNNVYTAGQLAVEGAPEAAYDLERHRQAQIALTGNSKSVFFPWPYPPTFLFVASLLALMPYAAAMFTWSIGSLAFFTMALWRIAPTPAHFAILLAMPAAWLNAFVGQNGALTAGLIGGALLALPSRPILAGVFIGLLSYKPHLGILFPIALIAAGHWRAFASAAVTVIALAVASIAAYGTAPWLAFPAQIGHVMALVDAADQPERLQSLLGFAIAIGAPTSAGTLAQSLLTLALVAAVAWTWRSAAVSFDLKAALLATAVTLASPYQFVYDLPVLTIAQAYLLRYLAANGPLSWLDVIALALVNVLILAFAATPVPLGFAACLLLAAVRAHKIKSELGTQRSIADQTAAAALAPAV